MEAIQRKNSTNGTKLREIVPHQSLVAALGTEISRQTVWVGTESFPKTSEMLKLKIVFTKLNLCQLSHFDGHSSPTVRKLMANMKEMKVFFGWGQLGLGNTAIWN